MKPIWKNLLFTAVATATSTLFVDTLQAQTRKDPVIKEKAARIHRAVLTLDTHGDLPYYALANPGFDISKKHDPYETGSRIDFPRMKEGELDAIFFAVYVAQGPRNPEGYEAAKQSAMAQFDYIHDILKKNADVAALATTPEDAYRLEKEGKRAIFIGVENGWAIGRDLSLLQRYYDLGARYLTLSHTRNNDICDSSTDPAGYEHGGLTSFGREVVREMNKIGLLIDVSHISDQAVYDCLEHSLAPIAATHSSARALFDHPRNLTDDLIRAIAEKGGVVQMNFLSGYLKAQTPERVAALAELREKYPNVRELSPELRAAREAELAAINEQHPDEPADLALVVDHIDYIVNLVGVDHVGIGPDLDGGGGVTGMYDVSEVGNITYELVKRGYTEEDIEKIWSGNFFRVMKEVERVSQSLR